MERLFHVSEEGEIGAFEPRVPPSTDAGISEEVVWAIDDDHLPNYLLPRDCPRVTYRISETTSTEDRDRFLGQSAARRVIAVESAWFARIQACRLFVYEVPTANFELADASAGYWIARTVIIPVGVTSIADPMAEILRCDVELRLLPSLWPLHDAVVASTLDFSIIRMRNACPRVPIG